MQQTRWVNNSLGTSKVILKKRAGSLSPEKLAQVQQQLFYDDFSANSSPNSRHLRNLLSPESLPSTEATFQHYNGQYYHSQDQYRVDSKISSLEATERVYSKVSPVAYKVSQSNYGSGETQGTVSSERNKPAKRSQKANTLDLEMIMPVETKQLYCELEQLTLDERRNAMMIDEDEFSAKIHQEIDCVGCVDSLHTYLKELAEIAKQKTVFLEGFVVNEDRSICFSEEKVGDIQHIAFLLHYHKNKNSIIDELARSLNIKKRNEGNLHRGKVLSRCLLHSKKPMPNGIWREALQNLIETNLNEVALAAELDEPTFASMLQMHTKRRKFCSTCKENIAFVYENMLDELSDCSDCEEDDENYEEEEVEGEEYEESIDEEDGTKPVQADERPQLPKGENVEPSHQEEDSGEDEVSSDSDNETDKHSEHHHHHKVLRYTRKGNLLSCLKYCAERKKIKIPLEMEVFMEFLSKAENGITLHSKHANTKEAAQEELIACIGTCLKERLQSIWRVQKSEELAKILFMKLAADCVVEGISRELEEKNYRLGHKTILEEYLNETEAAEQQKKQKLRQKRQKRKEKKKLLKQNMNPNGGDQNQADDQRDNDNDEEDSEDEDEIDKKNKKQTKESINGLKETQNKTNIPVENKEKDRDKESTKLKGKGQVFKEENKQSKEREQQQAEVNEEKINKKTKNKIVSPVYDKNSTNSNTPQKEEEVKGEIKKKSEAGGKGGTRNNRFSANDERERNLLLSMGWSEDMTEEVDMGVDEREINKMKTKWNEIKASREDFRKSAKEKFMRLCYSKQK